MTVQQYKDEVAKNHFVEFPYFIGGNAQQLSDFVVFDLADYDLKIHLAKVILCRCFSPTGGIYFPFDADWFISNFLKTYERDLTKPWITSAIKMAADMIMSDDTFDKGVIATTFMFGIIEYYAKHKLGFKPLDFDPFDTDNLSKFRNTFIGDAISKLKKTKTAIGKSLTDIDKHNIARLKEFGITEQRFTKARIADRLTLARNTMLHGENHSFYDTGKYLLMLYILFHIHEEQELSVIS